MAAAQHDPAPPGPTLLYQVKQLERAIRADLETVLRPHGVTTFQYTALTVLAHRDGLTSAALARRSFVTAQSMGDMVTTLENRGLISRCVDPNHARRLTISLTPAGRELLNDVAGDVTKVEAGMTSGLSARQRRDFGDYLRDCLHNLVPDPELH